MSVNVFKQQISTDLSHLIPELLKQNTCNWQLDPIWLQTDSRLTASGCKPGSYLGSNQTPSSLHTVALILVVPWSPATVFPSVTLPLGFKKNKIKKKIEYWVSLRLLVRYMNEKDRDYFVCARFSNGQLFDTLHLNMKMLCLYSTAPGNGVWN